VLALKRVHGSRKTRGNDQGWPQIGPSKLSETNTASKVIYLRTMDRCRAPGTAVRAA
jgi:hypothetical protein